MSDQTIARLLADKGAAATSTSRRRQAKQEGALIPITITANHAAEDRWSAQSNRLVVRGPLGLTIEGLSLASLAELIARVSSCSV
jgi:hypothetical protein